MHIDWTIGAGDSLRETLDYWLEHNGSIAYSNKILDEVLNVEKEIARQPLFLAKFLDEILDNKGTAADSDADEDPALPRKAQTNGTMVHITAIFGFALAGLVVQDVVRER